MNLPSPLKKISPSKKPGGISWYFKRTWQKLTDNPPMPLAAYRFLGSYLNTCLYKARALSWCLFSFALSCGGVCKVWSHTFLRASREYASLAVEGCFKIHSKLLLAWAPFLFGQVKVADKGPCIWMVLFNGKQGKIKSQAFLGTECAVITYLRE